MTKLYPGSIQTLSVGQYFLEIAPNGGATVQCLTTDGVFNFKVYATNDPDHALALCTPVPYETTSSSGVTPKAPGTLCTPLALDKMDVETGPVLFMVIDVIGGIGTVSTVAGSTGASGSGPGEPSPVYGAPVSVTDKSGTIATGGTQQSAIAVNTNRKAFFVLNPRDASESLWVSLVGNAVVSDKSSIELPAGASFGFFGPTVPSNAVSVIAATTGHKFTAFEA